MSVSDQPVIELKQIGTRFGDYVVHKGLDLNVKRGEVLALVGASGSGKTVLLSEIIMLRQPSAGQVRLFGTDAYASGSTEQQRLRRRFGVLFQHGALFSGMSVLENVGVPLREHTDFDTRLIDQIAYLKIRQTGLSPEAAHRYPSELSGGMIKRAALARAMVLDPQILFLDEPVSGLDPASADAFDDLVLQLKQWLGLTIVMITHDLDSLWRVADRVAVLGDRRVVAVAPMAELAGHDHPAVRFYFEGRRARKARED
jgi:phospholipid/cholesterol/gamma-HCH transport system ATP-binding protein